MKLRFPDARIVVFARAPRLGEVKTRLQHRLGAEGCLSLYRNLLRRTMQTVRNSQLAPLQLWVTDEPGHEDFRQFCSAQAIFRQQGADLGERMAHAAGQVLAHGKATSVIIVGTDCPVLNADYLARALGLLSEGKELVLGPVEDGGYILIGLRRPLPALFRDVDWGSAQVLRQTLAQATLLDLEIAVLETLWDLDNERDLARLQAMAAGEA